MKRHIAHAALAVAALGLMTGGLASAAKADTASEIAALKAQLKRLEATVARQKKEERRKRKTGEERHKRRQCGVRQRCAATGFC